jgi:hypothetical protein
MLKPSSEYFVAKPRSTRLPDDLPGEAAGSTGLFIFRSPHPDAAPREQWDRLMRDHGAQLEFASPIMIDDAGREMLPTGKVVVQFNSTPARDFLQQFETMYGLRYLKTNEFAANELSFQPVGSDFYLPELLTRLKANSIVKLAAPETMARYSRL